MNNPSRLRFLFVKYLQRQCSVEEVDELIVLMQEDDTEDALKEEMELLWEEFADDKTQHVIDWEEMYSSIINSEKRTDLLIHKAVSGRQWVYYIVSTLLLFCAILLVYRLLSRSGRHTLLNATTASRSYYFNNAGSDSNDGSRTRPWKTINKLNATQLFPGDTVYFESGQVFSGTILLDSNDAGSKTNSIVVTSTGKEKAVIDGGNGTAFTAYKTKFLVTSNLAFNGAGRKKGNTKDGVIIANSSDIKIDRVTIKGFQKSGLLIYSSNYVDVSEVYAADNGFAGIFINGDYGKRDCSFIRLIYCTAENNPGDPSNLTNHSGNGILAGVCRNVVIEHCVATNNGWDMPRKGNGPVGIWCYEADSVIIEHCISYKNKTAPGASDGGGFDLDGGVTNSVIQYCLSYENEGSGYGLFQYAGASDWNNNIIRYCISENDGNVSPAHAGIFIWNGSGDTNQFKNCYIYNNTVFNSMGAAISYEAQSANAGFRFYNNIFVGRDSIIIGKETNSAYLGNDWYSLHDFFNVDGINNFAKWCSLHNKETLNGKIVGFNIDPLFLNAGYTNLTLPAQLDSMDQYILPGNSILQSGGLDLEKLFGISTKNRSLNGKEAPAKGIGAIF